jgi:hypothetical protein
VEGILFALVHMALVHILVEVVHKVLVCRVVVGD